MKLDVVNQPTLKCSVCDVRMEKDNDYGAYYCPVCCRYFPFEMLEEMLFYDEDDYAYRIDPDNVVVEKAKLDEINAAIEKMIEYFEKEKARED